MALAEKVSLTKFSKRLHLMQHSNQTHPVQFAVAYMVAKPHPVSKRDEACFVYWNDDKNQWVDSPSDSTPFLSPEKAEAVASRVGGMLIS
jgi:hypothetical protein